MYKFDLLLMIFLKKYWQLLNPFYCFSNVYLGVWTLRLVSHWVWWKTKGLY